MSDEIYEHIICADVPFTSFAVACPDLRGRPLIINGVSTAYAMTGCQLRKHRLRDADEHP